MVSSPSSNRSPSSTRTAFEAKVQVGWLATSKKSAERMWLSRCSLLVSMDVASIVAETLEPVTSSPVTICPVNEPKRPRTLLTIMCRTLKETSECTGSMSQVPAV